MPVDCRRSPLKKAIRAFLLSLIAVASAYAMCLSFPEPFFRNHVEYENILLYSDRAIPREALLILRKVRQRLLKSAVYDPRQKCRVFICNDLARFKFFANYKYRVGGLNYELFKRNSFLRGANIAHDRLIGPSGNEVPGERTLTYFITHEIMHGVIAARTSIFNYYRLPEWIKDGYADYIARECFDFGENLAKFRNASLEMDPLTSGLYLKYHLFVAYLLDIKKIGTGKLLKDEYPAERIATELGRLSRP
jgi:hypothetical protein